PVLFNYAAFLNQGCLPGPLNSAAAYGTPNSNATFLAAGNLVGLNDGTDVYAGVTQDHNLHNIQSIKQPKFTSQEDLVSLHLAYHLTDNLTLSSITGFNKTQYTSSEDYNRVVPSQPFTPVGNSFFGVLPLILFPNGVVNDPQIGRTNLLATFDLSTAAAKEYTQELRLASSYKGRFNFSAGLFYSEETAPNGSANYFVFSNALTAFSQSNNAAGAPFTGGVPIGIDPSSNPAGTPANLVGHNYYDARSGGGYLKSYAAFGEVYYNIMPDLKLTLGGRITNDQLVNISYPILVTTGGTGFPAGPATQCPTAVSTCLTRQSVSYKEFTGRANLDWTPTLSFTDKTLIYATYSRGYKGGGFNTPCQVGGLGVAGGACPYPLAYAPEFINAYEAGTKNTLLGGSLQLNLTGFYYDYKGYQISTIVDKSSVNLNINSKIYGLEFESIYSPIRNFTVNANIGYLHTSIDNGQSEIDTINLTQGNPNYTLLHVNDGTACLAPTAYLASLIAGGAPAPFLSSGVVPGIGQAFPGACTAAGYAANNALFPAANAVDFANVNGVSQNLGGHKMPNSPQFTVSAGAQYVAELPNDWRATLRGDLYWQDSSYARIFNAVNDRLPSYYNVNATLTFANGPMGVDLQFYVKNLFFAEPLNGVYLTNETSGLLQNVFTLDPRTYGAQITKRF
ncbi:MAG: TonB-dependent receptor, partial [Gammaproteobacteria bacterium]